MKKVVFSIAAAALLVTGTIFVFAQKSRGNERADFGHGPFGKPAMFLRGLDLTEEQKTNVKEIFDAARSTVEPLMQQTRDNRLKLRELGKNGSFDQGQVEAIAAEQGSAMSKLIVEKERTKAQIFAILTDEQKAKAAEMQSRFDEKLKSRGQKHFGNGEF